jgi:hypothetical protein
MQTAGSDDPTYQVIAVEVFGPPNSGTHRQRSLDHLAALTTSCAFFTLRWNDPHLAARLVLDVLP